MSRRVAAGLPSRTAHNRSSLLVAVAAALVAAALPGCVSDGASDQLAEQEEQIEELERRVGDEQKPGTSTAPAPSTSESPGSSPEPGGASSASVTACGAAGSVFEGQVRIANVTTRNVPCQTAREFAVDFETTSGPETDFGCSEDASCTWRGWTCRNDGRQARSKDHRCEKGDRVVRWQARST